jgi:signal transduction histidine kinase
VWVGTNGLGLNKYNPSLSVFNLLGAYPGAPLTLSSNFVTAVYTRDDKLILVGTLEGLDLIDLARGQSKTLPVRGRDGKKCQIIKIFGDKHGKIWICTNKGLMVLQSDRVNFCGISALEDPGLIVYDMIELGEAQLLVATNRGLMEINDSKVSTMYPDGSMVVALINGQYWIESEERINLIGQEDYKLQRRFELDSTGSKTNPATSIKCFYQENENNVWIGTWGEGLALYDVSNDSFTYFKEDAGLPNTVIYGILEDQQALLWLSTNKGLCVFDKKLKKAVRNFSKDDGLQGDEFNTRAFFKSASGVMYFGGVNGLTFFNPERALQIPSFVPKTIVTGFYINNLRVERIRDKNVVGETVTQDIHLEWQERHFAFDVAGLGFTFPGATQYKYKLENFDDDWKFNGHESRITFTNIPPGKYRLFIKSANANGDWEADGMTINIIVHGPIWLSPWFWIGSVILVVSIIYLVYRRRTRMLKKRATLLQAMVEERTRKIQVQQEEIAAQNEELTAQAETLEQRNAALEKSNLELERVKHSLERRVEKRTAALKKANEELLEQNTQLEQFTFITAHNIRGPVARIKGLLSFLTQSDETQVIKHLETSVKSLDEVITDLSTILNIRQGISKSFEPVSLREQIELTIETLQEQITAVNAVINVEIADDVVINGAKPYVQSIFYNLIHNALKYCSTTRQCNIQCKACQEGDVVHLTIQDNGIGIDMRYAKEKIFKLYQRFHPNINGKGFGLFLVKTQVVTMGGTIKVQSDIDQGTVFSIDFPARSVSLKKKE